MFKELKGFLFLINVFFIFGKEYIIYLLYKDFPLFVERVAFGLSRINILCVKIFQAFALNNSLIYEIIKFYNLITQLIHNLRIFTLKLINRTKHSKSYQYNC